MKVKTASKAGSAFSSLLIVPKNTPEWDYMWNKLAGHRLNRGLAEPKTAEHFGEIWQYMESDRTFFGRYVHKFRHRLHPKTRKPEHLRIKGSRGLEIMPN